MEELALQCTSPHSSPCATIKSPLLVTKDIEEQGHYDIFRLGDDLEGSKAKTLIVKTREMWRGCPSPGPSGQCPAVSGLQQCPINPGQ